MRTFRRTMSALVVLALLATSTGLGATPTRAADEEPPVSAMVAIGPGLVTGSQAREAFEALARDGAVTFTDFEGVPTGPRGQLKLDGPATGITVRMRTTEFRYPLPPKRAPKDTPVIVLPHSYVSEPANHRLMGSNPGDIPDGQAKYQLVLSEPVSHAGLLRMWNTNSLTHFYDADGTLLAEHRNTENQEFVGYVAAGLGDRIKTIEFDGVPEDPKSKGNRIFQVGEVDDLYLGYGSVRSGVGGEEVSSLIDESEEELAMPGGSAHDLAPPPKPKTLLEDKPTTVALAWMLFLAAVFRPELPLETLTDLAYLWLLFVLLE